MEKYIDADKLKELINEKWKELADKNVKIGGGKWDAEISIYLSVLGLIDSLLQEQQEVDLDSEIEEYWIATGGSKVITLGKFKVIARYFYGLGQLNSK